MNRAPFFLLYLNVLVVATCGLVYELLAGTLASYVLGDSVTQFSLIIGVYLSALGVGAWLSRFIDEGLARSFVEVELGVALVGGASAPLLFLSFRLPELVSRRALRHRPRHRHSGRLGAAAVDADSQGPPRLSRSCFARAGFRLLGRSGGVAAVSRSFLCRGSDWCERRWCSAC